MRPLLPAALLAVPLLTGCRSTPWTRADPASLSAPPVAREFRGAWVATVANIDWPSEPGLSAERRRFEMDRILDAAERANLNALVLQVRPTADAFYGSRTEPWSAFLTGAQGQRPGGPDPLAEWIDAAHARGIDVHAWINPFRARHPASIGPDAPTHPTATLPASVRTHGAYVWLDPGDPAARAQAVRVVTDLLARYRLDGVHIDDYFYPYPDDGRPLDDDATWNAYLASGGTLGRDDWRRQNIDTLVDEIRAAARETRPAALFGLSPFGIWRPDHPEGVRGFDAYANLFADSRRWIAEPMADYSAPQLYWPIESEGQPFGDLLSWWASQKADGTHLWPGLYLTRILPSGREGGWQPDQIVRQIETIRAEPRSDGFILFSVKALPENRRGVLDVLSSGVLAEPAAVPESPWLGVAPPRAPSVAVRDAGDGAFELRVSQPAVLRGPEARRWVVRVQRADGSWQSHHLTHAEPMMLVEADAAAIVVSAVGPAGVEGPAAALTRR
jgi:uncharacterized lipoprotein YddW (UPF0748 family)